MSSYPLTGINQAPPPPVLYHYTSQAGLIGILSRKQIWATNIGYLNDTTEFRHGEDVIRWVVAKRRRSALSDQQKFFDDLEQVPTIIEDSQFFVASLTEAGDLLSQWRGYTPNANGFSVGFDSSIFTNLNNAGRGGVDFELLKCVYDEAQQRRMAEALLDSALDDWAQRNKRKTRKGGRVTMIPFRIYPPALFRLGASFLAPVFKSPAFSEEQEWRLIGVCKSPEQMKFRPAVSMIAPYLEVDLAGAAKPLGVPPVVSVTVGPCPSPALSRQSVQWLLEAESIPNTSVNTSRAPFRGW